MVLFEKKKRSFRKDKSKQTGSYTVGKPASQSASKCPEGRKFTVSARLAVVIRKPSTIDLASSSKAARY